MPVHACPLEKGVLAHHLVKARLRNVMVIHPVFFARTHLARGAGNGQEQGCLLYTSYKASDLASRLKKAGADVRVVMTRSACQFVAPLTFESLTGRRVEPVSYTHLDVYKRQPPRAWNSRM